MALNRITADSITDGTVIASDIADNTITLAKLVSGLLPTAIANSAASYANSAFTAANSAIAAATAVFANSGQLTANSSSGNVSLGLANTAVVAATYGGATNVASIIVDQFGRITQASNVAISASPPALKITLQQNFGGF